MLPIHFEDGSGIIVQSAGKRQVELDLVLHSYSPHHVENGSCLVNALRARLRALEHVTDDAQLLFVCPCKRDDGLEFLYRLLGESVLFQFGIDAFQANLVELVDSHGNVDDALGLAYYLGYAGEYLPVVKLDLDTNAETREHLVEYLNQLHLVEQRIASHDIAIKLIELAIPSLLRPVCPPNGLHLIALERQLKLFPVHHHIACKGNGEVVAKTFFTDLCRQMECVAL